MAWSNKKAGMKLEGFDPFLKKCKKLGPKIQAKVALTAVRAGSAEIRKVAKKLVKQNALGEGLTPTGRQRDHLHQAIISKAKAYGKDKIPVGTIGTEYKRAPHDHLVHDGTAAHTIPVPWPGIGEVHHPGSRGYPFMEIALETGRNAAQAAMISKLEKAIEKELQKDKDKK